MPSLRFILAVLACVLSPASCAVMRVSASRGSF
jgi:hypothetical protein